MSGNANTFCAEHRMSAPHGIKISSCRAKKQSRRTVLVRRFLLICRGHSEFRPLGIFFFLSAIVKSQSPEGVIRNLNSYILATQY